jgi:mono/diheme cytochrome c family protein
MSSASVALAALVAACGTEKIKVSKSDPTYAGAVLFSQRCSGCHTLSYAATHGSASNVRQREITNGPNFNVRCERPITRVLYAIENGGFSGAIMPQNVVVGQDAISVAQFVATYAGRQAATQPGGTPCVDEPIGSIPAPGATATTATTPTKSPTTPPSSKPHKGRATSKTTRP